MLKGWSLPLLLMKKKSPFVMMQADWADYKTLR